jgi:hypothetical protein
VNRSTAADLYNAPRLIINKGRFMQGCCGLAVVPFQPPGYLIWLLTGAVVLLGGIALLRHFFESVGGGLGAVVEQRPDFLTDAENRFLVALEQAVGGRYRIVMKVRLGDLLVARGSDSAAATVRNKIDRKHIDFVLCTHHPVVPVLAIELDDSSHDRPDRQERDRFVNACMNTAGLPILHVTCRSRYDRRELSAAIEAQVARV